MESKGGVRDAGLLHAEVEKARPKNAVLYAARPEVRIVSKVQPAQGVTSPSLCITLYLGACHKIL